MKNIIFRVAFGLLFAITAAAFQWVLWPWVGLNRFIIFYPAIILASLFGGLFAGLGTTLFGALAAVFLFFPPIFNFYVEEPSGWIPVFIFLTSGVFISVINERLQRRNRALARAEGISERKQLEIDLRTAVTAREEFLSIASHELRTPLTSLYLNLQLMSQMAQKHPVDVARLGDMSSDAFQASRQLAGLLDHLLDLTRINSGGLSLDKQEVDLSAAVLEGIMAVSEEASLKGSLITVKADQPVLGRWDPTRINQIISNLLSNAIKYGAGNPIAVMVDSNPKTHRAELRVRDQGLGIPLDMQSRIFERFTRVASGKQISGLGLGLYIVRQLVEAHGGSVHVESELRKGTLFVVELPPG